MCCRLQQACVLQESARNLTTWLCRGQALVSWPGSRARVESSRVSEPTSRASSRESSKSRVQFRCCAIESSQSLGESSPVSPRRVENFRKSLRAAGRESRVARRESRVASREFGGGVGSWELRVGSWELGVDVEGRRVES